MSRGRKAEGGTDLATSMTVSRRRGLPPGTIKYTAIYAVLGIYCVFSAVVFFWVVLTAFKSNTDGMYTMIKVVPIAAHCRFISSVTSSAARNAQSIWSGKREKYPVDASHCACAASPACSIALTLAHSSRCALMTK